MFVIFKGNVGQTPEIKESKNGTKYIRFSVAKNQSDKVDGEWVKETYWIDCVAFGRNAQYCADKIGKGYKVMIQGNMKFGTYNDKTNFNVTLNEKPEIINQGNAKTELVDDEIEF